MAEQEKQIKIGDCKGPEAMFVKLISSDDHEFIVKREHALTSGTIKAMLSGPGLSTIYILLTDIRYKHTHLLYIYNIISISILKLVSLSGTFAEHETNVINFREIPSHVLEKVCMYFTYKIRYTNSSTEIPEFPIEPEIALELLMAANFLDC